MRLQTTETLITHHATMRFVVVYVPPKETVDSVEASPDVSEVSMDWRGFRLMALKTDLQRVTLANPKPASN